MLLPIVAYALTAAMANAETLEGQHGHAADTCCAAATVPESAKAPVDTILTGMPERSSVRWISQLVANGFHINDSTIDYPAFPRFCLKVYNWGDRVFNSYDPEYVVSAGKNRKAQLKSHNWLETYSFIFPHKQMLHISGDMYADIGASCSFMAVSVGYMINANQLENSSDKRSFFGLDFTCALFSAEYTHTTTEGGAHITRFGKFTDNKHVHIPIENLVNHTTTAKVLYFFNHRKYSQAAAQCYSKYQLKSAGSWIVGAKYARQDVTMDIGEAIPEIWEKLPDLQRKYRFNYIDYMAVGGYAYNWVLKPKMWLFNVSPALGVGYKHTRDASTDNRRAMVATDALLSLNLVFNHRALFVGAHAKASGSFYFNGSYTFLDTFVNLQATVGVRF